MFDGRERQRARAVVVLACEVHRVARERQRASLIECADRRRTARGIVGDDTCIRAGSGHVVTGVVARRRARYYSLGQTILLCVSPNE